MTNHEAIIQNIKDWCTRLGGMRFDRSIAERLISEHDLKSPADLVTVFGPKKATPQNVVTAYMEIAFSA